MRFLVGLALALCFWSVTHPVNAAEDTEATVGKSDIKNIKIFSKDHDRINFFLTDNNKIKYRISNLTQGDAERILGHFKKNEQIILKTQPNTRGYLDVVTWQKK